MLTKIIYIPIAVTICSLNLKCVKVKAKLERENELVSFLNRAFVF